MDQDEQLDQALDAACDQTPDGKPTLRCENAFALAARFALPVEALGRRRK